MYKYIALMQIVLLWTIISFSTKAMEVVGEESGEGRKVRFNYAKMQLH